MSDQPAPTNIDELADQWRRVKAHEDAAKAERIEIEQKMLALMPEPESGEGSNTENHNYYKVTTTHGFTRTPIQDKIGELYGDDQDENSLISSIFPTSHKLDTKQLRAAESMNPDLFKRVCQAITTKPRKPSIKVVELESEK